MKTNKKKTQPKAALQRGVPLDDGSVLSILGFTWAGDGRVRVPSRIIINRSGDMGPGDSAEYVLAARSDLNEVTIKNLQTVLAAKRREHEQARDEARGLRAEIERMKLCTPKPAPAPQLTVQVFVNGAEVHRTDSSQS